MRVIYSDWGLANYYKDYIEINRDLKYNKKLRDYVIKHELGHKQGFDLLHEFDFKKELFLLFPFIIKHPKTWIDFSPIQLRNNKIIYDLNILMLYGVSIILIVLLFLIL